MTPALLSVIGVLAFGLADRVYAGETLRIVNNGGAVAEASREAWYEPFAAERGVEIVEDNWSQEYARLRTQVETGNLQWDVVEITLNHMSLACNEGYIEQVDWSEHLDPADFADAGGVTDCAVPIMSVVGGLAYDGDVFSDNPPKSWADFWDVETWPGKRGLLFRASTLEIALMADGVPPDQIIATLSTPEGIDRAFAKLEEIRDHIHWWRSGAESVQILATGEVAMAYVWNGRVATMNKTENRNFRYAFEAGFVLGNQYLAVMAGTSERELAIDFITYASSAEPLARFSNRMRYGPPNKQALEFVDPELLKTLPSEYMDKAYIQGGEAYIQFWIDNLESLTQRLATWAAQ
ncbi:ABC transporter substrate-binding protein [Paralimibaculum aggregatum]|uniref:ABC transporter substrate-binding protein n=1 Tax=Paralimibaculum aggregatum TaxID=3036245 RepID=A0ABQ6LS03_9RHOB|nr:ABC transporter substrate-binding protein [Limibaculum sp. NKW23]GMG84833.1 ABC transporter substrate-binding protein [Limibaculum sp. NKW23]